MLETVAHYLRNHPRDVGRLLETAPPVEVASFLDALGNDDRALVFAQLLPHTAASYLSSLGATRAAELITRLSSNVAARGLGALVQSVRRPIIDALPIEKQTNVRHILRYPEESVGSLMLTNTLACREDATVRRAKQLVRRFAHTELPMVVVLDQEMRPMGLIAVSKLLRVGAREFVRDHMRFVPARLRARATVASVLTLPAWASENYLPVVESDESYVGLMPKAALHLHALAAPAVNEQTDEFGNVILNIADLIWQPAAEMIARSITNTAETDNDE